ncbi:MAG: Crp/Fnr family transcriptional regulator [Dehalococcoidia bacterium]|nr:Crp/Fnr family transcriptional regulator [Dehalococcoidia bacterium]
MTTATAPRRCVARADDSRTVAALRHCVLARDLPPEAVAAIASCSTRHDFARNSHIFEEGQPTAGLWIVTAGRVHIQHLIADGRRPLSAFRAPVSLLNLGAAMDGGASLATAIAVEPSEAVLVPKELFPEILRRYPAAMKTAIDLLCLELRQRDIMAGIGASRDARGRIGCALLQLVREFGRPIPEGLRIEYRLTRQDIADRSNVTIETAIRVLAELQRQGAIRTRSRVIEILDLPALRAMLECDDCLFDCSVFAGIPAPRLTTVR